MKQFHLGAVLSITTGRLVGLKGMDDVYEILNYMTGDDLFTHQLPRAAEECAPVLLEQFPALVNVETPDKFEDAAHVYVWLSEQCVLFGTWFYVEPLAAGQHANINPVDELAMMMGRDVEVVVVDIPFVR